MADDVMHRTLFASDTVQIRDYLCCRRDRGLSAEDETPFDSVVIPRCGVFVKHVRGRTVVADPNHANLFHRGETYRVSHPYGCGDRVTEFAPTGVVLAELRRATRATHCPIGARPYLLHRLTLRAVAGGPSDPLAVEEVALRLVAHVHGVAGVPNRRRRRGRPATERANRERVEAVMLLLAARYAERWSLAAVAGAVHSSPYHLARTFRALTGRTVHRYLTQIRLRAALERIAEREADLSGLAHALGFSSHSHFTHAFRAAFGATPSAVRATATPRRLREMSKDLTAAWAASS